MDTYANVARSMEEMGAKAKGPNKRCQYLLVTFLKGGTHSPPVQPIVRLL